MNLYLLVFRTAPLEGGETAPTEPWTLNATVFETQEAAVKYAELAMVGKEWRLVMVPSVSVIQ
jgi:hypothetical protein